MAIGKTINAVLIFCGRNNLPLRGHRDSGRLSEASHHDNDGLLRNLLRFRRESGDEAVTDWLDTTPGNVSYLSPKIQNELISCIATVILDQLVSKVKDAKFFSVLLDETMDRGKQEQASFVIRHVSPNGEIAEDFFGFAEASNTTGEGLAKLVLDFIEKTGLSLENLRGQGYDGAAAMSGAIKGCQTIIKRQQPMAVYTHCVNHRLNLVISKACELREVRNALGVVARTATFFLGSAKRTKKLEDAVRTGQNLRSEEAEVTAGVAHKSRRQRLILLCPTRWVDRHDAVAVFRDLLPFVASVLEDMNDDEATSLLHAIQNPTLIVSVVFMASVLAKTVVLSKTLQEPRLDLGTALYKINAVTNQLQAIRHDAEREVAVLFNEAEQLGHDVGLAEITVPRKVWRVTQRANAPAESVAEHYRVNLFVPFLDSCLAQLRLRFKDAPIQLRLQQLLPGHTKEDSLEQVMEVAELHRADLQDVPLDAVRAEVETWLTDLEGSDSMSDSVSEAIARANATMCPNVALLLRLYGTLPVSNATVERSFSKLKLLKSDLRTTMEEERLSGLALLSVHRQIEVDPDKVMDVFSRTGKRRIFL